MKKSVVGLLLTGVIWFGGSAARGAEERDAAKPPNDAVANAADRLVRDALAAELAGDNKQRDEILAKALQEDPNCRAARWHSGFVSIDGKWLTVAEAVQKFNADPNLAAYRRLRDQAADAGLFNHGASDVVAGDTNAASATARGTAVQTHRPDALSPAGLAAHIELARWCRNKQLADEERAHWTQVLLEDPANGEAKSRLGMRLFMGSLMTNSQIEAAKKQHADEEQHFADWKPTVFRWRKVLETRSESEADRAAHEMEQVNDPAVIPALEWAVLSDAPKTSAKRDVATRFQRLAVALLSRMPQQRATYSLTGYAVLSPQHELRGLAAEQLKKRPLHAFVPLLLSGLANPIRFDYEMTFDPASGVASFQSVVSQEGPETINQVENSSTASGLRPTVRGGRLSAVKNLNAVSATNSKPNNPTRKLDGTAVRILPGPRNWSEVPGALALARQSSLLATSFDLQNSRIEELNERINFVLEQVTPQTRSIADVQPTDESLVIPEPALANSACATPSLANRWWNWWATYNELSVSKKVALTAYSTNTDRRYADSYGDFLDIPGKRITSCFAAGAVVATTIGEVPIEKLRIGDRVLAQDADTGELVYKPVLETTVRAPVEIVRVTTTQGQVRATRGHPFWIVGKGWRMAKELQVGDRIHGLHGSVTVTALAQEPPEKAYNLVVADFGTYFVGDGQILVHDNSQRLPTPAILPGFVKAE